MVKHWVMNTFSFIQKVLQAYHIDIEPISFIML
mgnify:CR=1 FL=1